jgi:predicted restriction endonuclease
MSVRSELRAEAIIRADYRCEWPGCDMPASPTRGPLEMSHIIPLGSGGEDTLENVWMLDRFHHDLYDGRSPFKRRELRVLVVELMRLRRG